MKIPDQRTAIHFRLVEGEGGGVYLSQAPPEEAIAYLREYYGDRLAAITSARPERPAKD